MPSSGVSASQALMPEVDAGGGGTYAICRRTNCAAEVPQGTKPHTIMVQQMLSVQRWFSSPFVESRFKIRSVPGTAAGLKVDREHCEAPWAWYMLTCCCENVCATLTNVERVHPDTELQE